MVLAAFSAGIGAGAMAAQANAPADPAAHAFYGRDGICCRALSISLNRQRESGNPPSRFMALANHAKLVKKGSMAIAGQCFFINLRERPFNEDKVSITLPIKAKSACLFST